MKAIILSLICLLSLGLKAEKMNVLFIVVDDLRPILGCYGDSKIKTPNIDLLAERGVVFERAYVQQAICSASRASFLTGCRPQSTGVNFPYTPWFNEVFRKQYKTLPEFMTMNGFYTRSLGKIHHGPADEKLTELHYDADKSGFYLKENLEAYNKRKKRDTKAVKPWEHADLPDSIYADAKIANETIKTMKRAVENEKPFFIAAGFLKPHLPFVCPKKYYDLYESSDIELSAHSKLSKNQSPVSIMPKSGARKWWDFQKGIDEENSRQLIHSYMACVSFIDAQVGRVLKELEDLGIKNNTAVFFLSDHGWHLGDHGQWGKSTNYELATRTPLIISVPKVGAIGKKLKQLVEFVDLYPTIAELSGLELAEYLEGKSLLPLLKDAEKPWKKAVFSQYPRGTKKEGFSVRTEHWRYTEWRTKNKNEVFHRELYHCQKDPLETKNLEAEAEHQNQLLKMQGLLQEGWKGALPEGLQTKSALADGDDSWYRKR